MTAGHLSAVIQLGDYATAVKRFLVRMEPEHDRTELSLLHRGATRGKNDEWLWERSQEGDAVVSLTEVLPVAALNVEAVMQTANSRGCVCLLFLLWQRICHCDAVAIAIPSTNKLEKRHSNEKRETHLKGQSGFECFVRSPHFVYIT